MVDDRGRRVRVGRLGGGAGGGAGGRHGGGCGRRGDHQPLRGAGRRGQVAEEARRAEGAGEGFDTWGEWSRYYTARCTRLAVLYSTIEVEVSAEFKPPPGKVGDKPTPEELRDAHEAGPEPGKPQILCTVAG